MAETCLALQFFLHNWHIINPLSHLDELSLYRRKENNLAPRCDFSHKRGNNLSEIDSTLKSWFQTQG